MVPTVKIAVARLMVFAAAAVAAGCFISRTTHVDPVVFAPGDSAHVVTPVRAHLRDGSTILFAAGATVVRDTMVGEGKQFDPLLSQPPVSRGRVALDSVVGVEALRSTVNSGRTMMYSLAPLLFVGLAAGAGGGFGSCPTFYSDSGDTLALEAEGFSYSISSLLEARDVDRLRARPDSTGVLRLQVWNEALETHYLNHLALIETTHGVDELVVPDVQTRPIAVRGSLQARLTDRRGRDVSAALTAVDAKAFASDSSLLRDASDGSFEDWIEIVVPRPDSDSLAVVIRLRNSLLNTVLFYDFMLARAGPQSLNWMGKDLEQLSSIAELGQWYAQRFGMRASVFVGGEWRTVGRLADRGPIAWHDVAFVLPVPAGDSVRVRLSFLVDQWRIDHVRVAPEIRRPAARTVSLAGVTDSDGREVTYATEMLRNADEDFLQTMPGNRFTARFEVGRDAPATTRTFLLVSQGYYTEWVRGQWMKNAKTARPFIPGDSTLRHVVQSWVQQKDSLELQFFRNRVPVR